MRPNCGELLKPLVPSPGGNTPGGRIRTAGMVKTQGMSQWTIRSQAPERSPECQEKVQRLDGRAWAPGFRFLAEGACVWYSLPTSKGESQRKVRAGPRA